MTKTNIVTISILILGVALIFFVQFLTPTLYGADGYLHIRMAEFLRDLGPRYDFHWARYSTFTEHFSDKDFLYHAALIPFTFFKDIFFGAKLAAAIFAALLFFVFYLILKRYSDKKILLFFLIPFFFSDMFLQAISRPRPISLVVMVSLLAIHLIIKKRHGLLFLTALLYSLGHITSPLIIIYALIVEIVRYVDKKEFCAKTIMVTFLGVLTGFIIHPNVPNNFLVFYLNSILVPIYTIKTGVLELGAEFFPLNTRELLLSYPVVVAGVIGLVYLGISRRPKARFETKVFLALSMVFFVLSFICRRYLLHGYPIMLIALACYCSDSFSGVKNISKKAVVFIIFGMAILGFNSFKAVKYNGLVTKIVNTHYEQAGRWMEQNIPEGELIFHANWSDSQYFIGLNPKNDYFVTLDPVYMYKQDPGLYKLYRDVAFGKIKDPYVVLKDTFKVKYGYISKNYFSALIEQIRPDKRFNILAEDNFGVIFNLT
ncbi:MAG: hypothetical protein HQ532_05230 [Candidatus Omnitrophica bacterium]|nr:hypothetical protein [Candidatus Omnitrophota bacterium]